MSIGGEAAPSDPRAALGAAGADVSLAETSTVEIIAETTNVEPESQVIVRLSARNNDVDPEVITAVRIDPPLSTDPLVYQWSANLPVNAGFSAVQARVIRP